MTEDNDTSSSSVLMCDDCGIEESVSNNKVCISCEQKVSYCKSSVDDNSLCDEDNDTNDTSSNNNDSSSSTDEVAKFKAGDHITLQCNAAGVIPYDHHAIVLSTRSDGEGTLCVADFTAGDAGKSAYVLFCHVNSSIYQVDCFI